MKQAPTPRRRIAVTGASGLIGRRFIYLAGDAGHGITALARNPARLPKSHREGARRFCLGEDLAPDLLTDIDVVVHLATTANSPDADPAVDRCGSQALIEAARQAGVSRFIFVSSIAADADAPTGYGRAKKAVEELLTEENEFTLRSGFVYALGPPFGGAFGSLCAMLRKAPCVPVINPNRPIQPIHRDEVCAALLALIDLDRPPKRVFQVAAPEPARFIDFVRWTALSRWGTRPGLIPTPAGAALAAAGALAALGLASHSLRERIAGLTRNVRAETSADLKQLNMELGDWRDAYVNQRRSSPRPLLREAHTLVRYVTGAKPSMGVLRRYVRAIRAQRTATPLAMPLAATLFPALTALWEIQARRRHKDASELRLRLHMAMVLAETTPSHAQRFVNLGRTNDWQRAVGFIGLGLQTAAAVVFAILPFGRGPDDA